jgi:anti-sigma28 factor (negative regulator of flagellin synthesis)
MSDFSSIGPGVNGVNGSVNHVHRLNGTTFNPATGPSRLGDDAREAASSSDTDRVEVSDFARYLDHLRNSPGVRQQLVDQVRQSIDAGTYETDAKIDAAIENWAREEL